MTIKSIVRELRKNQTKAEKMFWQAVRNRKLKGLKFYRQYPIIHHIDKCAHFYVADFCCFEKKLVIEIDGPIHKDRKDYDQAREYVINELGFTVLRFKNQEVEFGLNAVLEKIVFLMCH